MGNYVNDYQRPGQNSAVNTQRQAPPQQPPQNYQEPNEQANGNGQQQEPPWHTLRFWTGTGTLFINIRMTQSQNGPAKFSVSTDKSYKKKGSDKYEHTKSLFLEDIPVMIMGLEEAFKIIHNAQVKT